jgi:purine-binding chemotaxis protein CheW
MADSDNSPTSNLISELPSDTEGAVQYLLCALAGQEYGIRLDTLQEVLRFDRQTIAPVPNTPEWLEGIYSLRGMIISVVNLQSFWGLSPSPETTKRFDQPVISGIGAVVPRLLVLHADELMVGAIVDDIRGVLFVKPEQMQPVPTTSDSLGRYLEGIYTDQQTSKITWLVDTRRLITSPEMLVFEPRVL